MVNIGITGQLRGLVLLAMPKEVACDIASRMCFMTIEKLDEISLSALSELGNMIFGNAATVLSTKGIIVDKHRQASYREASSSQAPMPKIYAFR